MFISLFYTLLMQLLSCRDKIQLTYLVIGLFEAAAFVGLPRAPIIRVHVEAQTAHVSMRPGQCPDMFEKRAEDTSAPERHGHINALNPPKISVAPITPFVSDEQLSRNRRRAVVFDFG